VEKLGLVQGCVAGWSIISREGRPGKIYYNIVSVFAIELLSRQVSWLLRWILQCGQPVGKWMDPVY
jgi:hypothetical protein